MRLGILHVERDILGPQGITAKQFMEWQHYAALEPFDETRDDYRAASIVTMIANVNRGKDHRAYSIEDFVLKFGSENSRQRQTSADHLMIARWFTGVSDTKLTPDLELLKVQEDWARRKAAYQGGV